MSYLFSLIKLANITQFNVIITNNNMNYISVFQSNNFYSI